jgi:type I restriction enzyme S subunit
MKMDVARRTIEKFSTAWPFAASPTTPTKPTRPGWRWHRLTDLARLATGHTPSRQRAEYWKGEVPWLQFADIRTLDGRTAINTSEYTNELGIQNSAAILLPKGTVCMSRTASIGFVTIMGREMATSQDFVNWVCGPDLAPSFLMRLLIACREPIRDLGSGAVHHTIYFPTVEKFSICLPSLPEQRRIARLLSEQMAAVETARAAAEEALSTINALPSAFLRQAFYGKS